MPEARKKEWSFDFEGDDHEDLTGTPMMATTITTDDGESPDWSFDFEDDHEDLTGTPMMATTITTDDGESPDWSFDFE